jgi:hypothetical protein
MAAAKSALAHAGAGRGVFLLGCNKPHPIYLLLSPFLGWYNFYPQLHRTRQPVIDRLLDAFGRLKAEGSIVPARTSANSRPICPFRAREDAIPT